MRKRIEGDLLTFPNAGFPTVCHVANKYGITNGLLHSVGSGVARSYHPFNDVRLPTALARVADEMITPLEFASEFGGLGYPQMVRNALLLPPFSAHLANLPEWEAPRAAFQKYRYEVSALSNNLPEGDRVDWLKAHSRTVAFCLQFIGLLNDGNERVIRDEVDDIPRNTTFACRASLIRPVKSWHEDLQSKITPSSLIRVQLSRIITENIAGVRREFVTDPFGSRTDSVFIGTTIEAVYWQLADKMEARMVRRCEECNRFFVARDKRQQYCPPLPGSTRSRCSSRQNVKNFRDRQG